MTFGWFKKNEKMSEEDRKLLNREAEEIRAKALKDSIDSLVRGISSVISSSNLLLLNKIDDIEKLINKKVLTNDYVIYSYLLFKHIDPVNFLSIISDQRKESIRDEAMIAIIAAKNEIEAIKSKDEALKKQGLNPEDWKMVLRNNLPVSIIIPSRQENNYVTPVKNTPVIFPIDTYISNLLYARDKFVDNSYEKGVITKIINKIKEKHAITT